MHQSDPIQSNAMNSSEPYFVNRLILALTDEITLYYYSIDIMVR